MANRKPRKRKHEDLAHLPPDEYARQAELRRQAKLRRAGGALTDAQARIRRRKYADIAHLPADEYNAIASKRNAEASRRKRGVSPAKKVGIGLKAGSPEYYRYYRYGVTPEQYTAMLEAQGGKCAICETEMEKPYVDHCHDTGKVRGLLCHDCNTGIGKLRHSKELFLRAIAYCN